MQFTKLRIEGFKSFVDPTELVILPGLTGVVGPNGCGKSNLLEALRWVMGESRARAMRGDGMNDVIFAGSHARPARARARVELLIDNSARRAPAPFNAADDIEIGRRITRDIGSAFTLNGRTVRARDIHTLFADAATGASSPALVRQGQISELIEAKPRQRRRILEDAAGISGLHQRRHESELKLNAAEANLARVDDVLEGLETQLRSLARQAGEARRYRRLAEALRRAERRLLELRLEEAEAAAAALAAQRSEILAGLARAEAAVLATERDRETAEAALPPLREEETVAAAVYQRLAVERDAIDERRKRAEAEISALARTAGQLAADLERERQLGSDAGTALERIGSEQETLRRKSDGAEAQERAAEAAASAAAEALARDEAAFDAAAADAARRVAEAEAAAKALRDAETAAAAARAALARDAEAAAALEGAVREAEGAVARARAEAAAAADAAGAAETRLAGAEEAMQRAREAEAAARRDASETAAAHGAVAAERKSVEALLADAQEGAADRLIDRIEVAPGYEAALGAIFGDTLALAECAGDAGPETGWRALEALEAGAPLPAGAEPLGTHVEAPAALSRRLARVWVVPAEAGAALQPALGPGWSAVSRDGDLWRWDGLCRRGADAPSPAAMRLARRNRLKALRESEAGAEAAATAAAEAHRAAREALQAATAEERAAREARRAAEGASAATARALAAAETEAAKLEARRAALAEALEARRAAEAEAAAAHAAAEARAREVADPAGAQAALAGLRDRVAEARKAMLAARAAADEVSRANRGRERRLAALERERTDWERRAGAAGGRIEALETRTAEATEARKSAEERPAEIAAEAARLGDALAEAQARRKRAADALGAGESALAAAAAAARAAEKAASAAREERARLEVRSESAETAVAEARQRLAEAPAPNPAPAPAAQHDETAETEPAERALPDTPRELEAEIARLTRKRDAIGPVNLRAEADREEVGAERDTLLAEKADLEAAIAKLRGAIGSLNREGRQRLTAAFDRVNTAFAGLFRELFGGGEARLVMVEDEDPLEAGLEILCQPPGKKLSSLSLLSGGEQTLTALSLILAVFLCQPSPICVLDEVDAPLDDSNVARFCALLDRMRRETDTRFLVITHHPLTMSRMDRLYGVTMVERGVSQLVSVDLAAAAALVDA